MKFTELLKQNKLFDSHCHLNTSEYDSDREEVIKRAESGSIISIIDIAVNLESTQKAIETSKQNSNVFASAGIDPEVFIQGSSLCVDDGTDIYKDFEQIISLVEANPENIIMIGETGVDLYWNKKNELEAELIEESFEYQTELFKKHIKVAKDYQLPLSIHSRDAVDECIGILSGYEDVTGIFHSLTPDFDDDQTSFEMKVRKILETGNFISINGIITYKSASILRNTVLKILKEKYPDKVFGKSENMLEPIDFYNAGFIFETDGPYLAPEGRRGERNEPAFIQQIFSILVEYF